MAVIGTETEYGIAAPGHPAEDPVRLSELVVAHHAGPATAVLRGVHNRVLGNGARLYVDHGHPEYATPETTSPTDAAVHGLAGDALVAEAARRASAAAGTPIRVFKNNTDGKGSSYGYHENYLMARGTPFERVVEQFPAHLVTRVVYAGAGRLGVGASGKQAGRFQLSQRADYFDRLVSLDTTRRRGLINTRDEPHARPSAWRRLHVIPGDATRNPFATWLKLGTTALVLAALEAGMLPTVSLADPVAAFRRVSRDTGVAARLRLAGGGRETALGVQRRLLQACAAFAERHSFPEAADVLREWARVLDDLAADPAGTADRLDWPARLDLLSRLAERHGVGLDDPRAARLDLAWADLDPAGPYGALQRAGRFLPWIDAADVAAATSRPPADTRAYARGRLVADHPDLVVAATWDSVLLRDARGVLHPLRMSEPTSWTAADFDPSVPLPGVDPPP